VVGVVVGHDGLGGVFHSDVRPDLSMLQVLCSVLALAVTVSTNK
jgi:hypothetical protein